MYFKVWTIYGFQWTCLKHKPTCLGHVNILKLFDSQFERTFVEQLRKQTDLSFKILGNIPIEYLFSF